MANTSANYYHSIRLIGRILPPCELFSQMRRLNEGTRYTCHTDYTMYNKDLQALLRMKLNQLSCSTSERHNIIHNVGQLKDGAFWKEQTK